MMTWHELRSKCRRQSDYIITLFFTDTVSLFITWLLLPTRVTPNQVTTASILCGLICAIFYASGHFLAGSLFLFLSHVLDCTDGNLARAKETFSKFGRWLDFIGDRIGEVFIFLGISIYFYRIGHSASWIFLAMLDSISLLLYYYIVDIAIALKISQPKQMISAKKFKGVHVKWGLYEPVIYGFIILTPFGLLKLQLMLVLLLIIVGFGHQMYKIYVRFKSRNSNNHNIPNPNA